MKIKLLERDDIRRFNGTVVDVADHIAQDLINRGRAQRVDGQKIKPRKAFMAPPQNKMVWSAPEEKAMAMQKSAVMGETRTPKANDPLFPKSIIS